MFFKNLSKINLTSTSKIATKFDQAIALNFPGKAWRSTTQSPEETRSQNGFKPLGKDKTLALHVEGKPGVYIAYGQSLLDATKFCRAVHLDKNSNSSYQLGFGSHVYLTNTPAIHVNVRQSYLTQTMASEAFGQPSFALQENELAGIGSMLFSDIYKARKFLAVPGIGLPYFFIGPTFTNQDFVARNWSISIASACIDEAEYFENGLRKLKFLKDDVRFITPFEADTMAIALREEGQKYHVKPTSQLKVFATVPAHFNHEQALNYVVDEYNQFNRQHEIEVKSTSISVSANSIFGQPDVKLIAEEKSNMKEEASPPRLD